MEFIEAALKFGIESNMIMDNMDRMFAAYCIVQLLDGKGLTPDEVKRANEIIEHYGLDGFSNEAATIASGK